MNLLHQYINEDDDVWFLVQKEKEWLRKTKLLMFVVNNNSNNVGCTIEKLMEKI